MGSGVPIKVLKQAEEAEKIYQDQISGLMGPTGGTFIDEPPPGATGEIEDPGDTTPTGPTGNPEEESAEQKAEKAKHKYDVLRGKYDKEVPELSQKVSAQDAIIKTLQEQIADLQKGSGIAKPVTKGLVDSLVDKDPELKSLKEEYPEVFDGMKKLVEQASSQIAEKLEHVSEELDKEKTRSKKTEKDKFYEDLDSVKGWEAVNESSEFNEWLDEVEPLTGFKRRDILSDAYTSLNSNRVKTFFTQFLNANSPHNANTEVKDKKETGIAPGNTGTRPKKDNLEVKGKLIKASEVTALYSDIRKGLYKGRDEERAKREAEIDRAIAENRIVAGQ